MGGGHSVFVLREGQELLIVIVLASKGSSSGNEGEEESSKGEKYEEGQVGLQHMSPAVQVVNVSFALPV